MAHTRRARMWTILLAGASAAGVALAASGRPQTAPSASARANGQAAQTADKADLFDSRDSTYDARTSIATGHDFHYTRGDVVTTGAFGRYNKQTKILDADGNLVMDDPKHHITADKGHLDENKRLGTLTGSVVLTLKPEGGMSAPSASASVAVAATPGGTGLAPVTPPSGVTGGAPAPDQDRQRFNNDKKKGGVVTCDRLDNYYRRKYIYLRGHVVGHQRFAKADGKMLERTLTAQHAEYDGRTDKLYLFPPVHIEDSDGNLADSPNEKVTVGTKEGQETLEGKDLHIKFYPGSEETGDDKKKTEADDTAVPPQPE